MSQRSNFFLIQIILFLILTIDSLPQWQASNDFYGEVKAIYQNNNILYVATDRHFYKSSDEGVSWSANLIPTLLYKLEINSIIKFGGDIYVTGWTPSSIAILRSSDEGESWSPIKCSFKCGSCMFTSGDSLYVGTSGNNIFLLTNKGNKQRELFLKLQEPKLSVTSLVKAGRYIFAGTTTNGIYRSTDNGNSWSYLNNCLYGKYQTINSISVKNDTLIIGTQKDSLNSILLYSTNYGDDWKNLAANLPSTDAVRSTHIQNENIYVTGYFSGKYCLYKTSNFGLSWQLMNSNSSFNVNTSVCFLNSTIFSSDIYKAGIYKTTDKGNSWVSSGLNASNIKCFTKDVKKNYLYVGTDRSEVLQREPNEYFYKGSSSLYAGLPYNTSCLSMMFQLTVLYIGTNKGLYYLDAPDNFENKRWTLLNDGLPVDSINSIISFDNYNRLYAATNSGVYTTDYFLHPWKRISTGLSNLRVKSLILSGRSVFAGTEEGVFAITYPDTVWYALKNGLTGNSLIINSITLIGDYIYIGTKNGVYYCTYTNTNWISAGLTNYDINFIHAYRGIVFAATKTAGIFYSSNNGVTWQTLNDNLKDLNVYSLITEKNSLWAISDNGWLSYRQFNNYVLPASLNNLIADLSEGEVQLSWNSTSETGTQSFEIQRKFDEDSDYKIIGFVEGKNNQLGIASYSFFDKLNNKKDSKALYRLKQIEKDNSFSFSNTAIVNNSKSDIDYSTLFQNYPNPFNPSTTIRYTVKDSGPVKIEVFNLLGQKIKCLVDEYQKTGVYNISFNAMGLSSGVYIYRLNINGVSSSKNMIYLK